MTAVIGDLEACLAGGAVSAAGAAPFSDPLSNPFRRAGSGTMGSEDPAVQDFLNAISPAASATNVRTSAGTAPASETMASRIGEHTQATGLSSRRRWWQQLSTKLRGLFAGGFAGALLLIATAWSLSGNKLVETVDVKPPPDKQQPPAVKKRWQGWPRDAPQPAVSPFDAETAKEYQAEWAKYLKIPVEYTNSIGMKFRLIPPGEFLMGSTAAEIKEAHQEPGSELPQHKVSLTRPSYLSSHEVTQKEYETVMGTNPSYFAAAGEGKEAVAGTDTSRHPVEMVSWNDSAEFCEKLSAREGQAPFYLRSGEAVKFQKGSGYRLPTEAEWEFACRSGTTTRFWTGDRDEDLLSVGWIPGRNVRGGTNPVGKNRANPFGFLDVYGNVWEWVQDAWEAAPLRQATAGPGPAIDPDGLSGSSAERVARGGDWNTPASRCLGRPHGAPHKGAYCIGFRVALPARAVQEITRRDRARGLAERLKNPDFENWMEDVAAKPPGEQVAAVAKKLKELNAKFDGNVSPSFDESVVSGLSFASLHVMDLAPVRALTSLRVLSFREPSGKHQLADLSPLRGLSLTHFDCTGTQVSDLSPLAGMPLIALICDLRQPRDYEILRSIKTLETINSKPAAQFWKEFDGRCR